jgi:hypothetical protein
LICSIRWIIILANSCIDIFFGQVYCEYRTAENVKALIREFPGLSKNHKFIGVHLQNAIQLLELLAPAPSSKNGKRWVERVRDIVSVAIEEYTSGKRMMIVRETGAPCLFNVPPPAPVPVDAPPPAPVPVDAPPPAPVKVNAPPPAPVPVNVPPPAPSPSEEEIEERARAQARKRKIEDLEIQERELAIKERELAIAERSLVLANKAYIRID